jgi:hypothetical protein
MNEDGQDGEDGGLLGGLFAPHLEYSRSPKITSPQLVAAPLGPVLEEAVQAWADWGGAASESLAVGPCDRETLEALGRHQWPAGHPDGPWRPFTVLQVLYTDLWVAAGVRWTPLSGRPATDEEVARAHTQAFVAGLRGLEAIPLEGGGAACSEGEGEGAEAQAAVANLTSAVSPPDSVRASRLATGTTLDAVGGLLRG